MFDELLFSPYPPSVNPFLPTRFATRPSKPSDNSARMTIVTFAAVHSRSLENSSSSSTKIPRAFRRNSYLSSLALPSTRINPRNLRRGRSQSSEPLSNRHQTRSSILQTPGNLQDSSVVTLATPIDLSSPPSTSLPSS